MRVHAGDINDKLLTATQAGEVTIVGEPEVDVTASFLYSMGHSHFEWLS